MTRQGDPGVQLLAARNGRADGVLRDVHGGRLDAEDAVRPRRMARAANRERVVAAERPQPVGRRVGRKLLGDVVARVANLRPADGTLHGRRRRRGERAPAGEADAPGEGRLLIAHAAQVALVAREQDPALDVAGTGRSPRPRTSRAPTASCRWRLRPRRRDERQGQDESEEQSRAHAPNTRCRSGPDRARLSTGTTSGGCCGRPCGASRYASESCAAVGCETGAVSCDRLRRRREQRADSRGENRPLRPPRRPARAGRRRDGAAAALRAPEAARAAPAGACA